MTKYTATLPALKLSFSAGMGANEDSTVSAKQANVRLLAAFDGCGGVGSRRYPQLNNHTGAYLASGLYAQSLETWFAQNASKLPRLTTAHDLTSMFLEAAADYDERYLRSAHTSVTGSMVRTLPSTAAIAFLFEDAAALYWAGNTRIYLLTDTGLTQLTQDDLITPCNAFDSLYLDSPITNYLCVGHPFALHQQLIKLPERGILILATDGAFQALPTPMHFEALLEETMTNAADKREWKKLLKEQLVRRATDDVTLVLQPFGFTAMREMQAYFDKRRRHVQQAYILPADSAERNGMTALRALWEMYCKE